MTGRPRKLALSDLQRRILWALEEAGEETLPLLLRTLREHDEPPELLTAFRRATLGLMDLGFVTLEGAPALAEPAACLAGLDASDVADPARVPHHLQLLLSPAGRRALTS
jgi:hypothetical protein